MELRPVLTDVATPILLEKRLTAQDEEKLQDVIRNCGIMKTTVEKERRGEKDKNGNVINDQL